MNFPAFQRTFWQTCGAKHLGVTLDITQLRSCPNISVLIFQSQIFESQTIHSQKPRQLSPRYFSRVNARITAEFSCLNFPSYFFLKFPFIT